MAHHIQAAIDYNSRFLPEATSQVPWAIPGGAHPMRYIPATLRSISHPVRYPCCLTFTLPSYQEKTQLQSHTSILSTRQFHHLDSIPHSTGQCAMTGSILIFPRRKSLHNIHLYIYTSKTGTTFCSRVRPALTTFVMRYVVPWDRRQVGCHAIRTNGGNEKIPRPFKQQDRSAG